MSWGWQGRQGFPAIGFRVVHPTFGKNFLLWNPLFAAKNVKLAVERGRRQTPLSLRHRLSRLPAIKIWIVNLKIWYIHLPRSAISILEKLATTNHIDLSINYGRCCTISRGRCIGTGGPVPGHWLKYFVSHAVTVVLDMLSLLSGSATPA